MKKALLAAIDGSVYSSNSLDYLALLFASDPTVSIHLLSVAASGGAGKDWMHDVDPHRTQSPAADKHSRLANRHGKEAEERLVRKGIASERIHTLVKTVSSGISAAIREQAEAGKFDALVVGRRGLGAMGSLFLGSTSGELIEQSHATPLWIVDGTVTTSRFLLAVHNHPASLMAADHLGFIFKNHPNVEICLYHSDSVFGSQQSSRPEEFHTTWGKAWCDQYLDIDNFLFYAHAQLLLDSGISRHRITQLPVQMHLDVSSDLLRQAKKYSCGTIVIGRRRRDTAKGQFKGISDKTAKQAENIAIWFAG